MALPEQFLDELVARSEISDVVSSYVNLTRKGSNLWGLCPFHNEKTPSFSVSPDKQIYKCFGCGKGGGVISFIMEIENLSFIEAVRLLAQRAGMEMPEEDAHSGGRTRARIVEANRDAARFFHEYLKGPKGEAVRRYLEQRRIAPRTATHFGLGAAPDGWDGLIRAMTEKGYSKMELLSAGLVVAGKNGGVYDKFRSRLMLPVIDTRGDVVGFTSRILPGQEGAKYLNTGETQVFKKSRLLYALNFARKTKRPNLILVEGNLDVITLHQAGFDNAVATMGTALTAEHARTLSKCTRELILCYDNDSAGKTATDRALTVLRDVDLNVRVLQLPNATDRAGNLLLDEKGQPMKQDPDDFIKNFGPAAFEKLLSGSAGKNDYRLESLTAAFDLQDEQGRLDFLKKAVDTAAAMPSPIERELFAAKAAEAAGISRDAMNQEVARTRRGWARREKKREERRNLTPRQQLQPKERNLRYENLRSARAEEGVLRLMLLEPSLFHRAGALEPEHFSSPLLGKVYGLLRRRFQEGRTLQLANLAGDLTPEEMSHLVDVTEQPESLSHSQEALRDYIEIIENEYAKRSGTGTMDPLLAAQEKYREKKAYGG
ncbi:MAG TPA: DNA primase [Candidatus Galloscillospira excrementavium]|nr:DNA primase [Candidatus Galloscillospira excrementavium]